MEEDQLTETRIVVTESNDERDTAKLATAEALLQLKSMGSPSVEQDNSELLPVDALRQEDFAKELAQAEASAQIEDDNEQESNNDGDGATVIYDPPTNVTPARAPTQSPRKGSVTFKHYVIR